MSISPEFSTNSGKRCSSIWSHEYQPSKLTGALQYSTVPTALERSGDFTGSVRLNAEWPRFDVLGLWIDRE
jgi:hypothetical protein